MFYATTGCETVRATSLTVALWDMDSGKAGPAASPELRVWQLDGTPDLLVEYREASGEQSPKTRCYLLGANQGRIAAGQKPRFMTPDPRRPKTAVPVFSAASAAAQLSPAMPRYAVMDAARKADRTFVDLGGNVEFGLYGRGRALYFLAAA